MPHDCLEPLRALLKVLTRQVFSDLSDLGKAIHSHPAAREKHLHGHGSGDIRINIRRSMLTDRTIGVAVTQGRSATE
jgi:hypothetical protein